MKKLTLTMPAETHRKLKILAAQEGQTMASIVVECIEARCKGRVELPKLAEKKQT